VYVYIEWATGKRKRTRGKFVGWTKPMGSLGCSYAQFRNPRSVIAVPEYCIPHETRKRIGSPPERKDEE